MTVPGLNETVDDKEKLVIKTNVATIMPNRERLIKIRKRRYVLRLIISMALFLLLMATIFLTICYIRKIGPFKRIYRGRFPIGNSKYGHRKIYESCEITDDYEFINVPKFYVKFGKFLSVKTLHVFKKKLTVIQYNGICFVKPMLKHQGFEKNWYERVGHIDEHHTIPQQYNHFHWQISRRPSSVDYLRKHVHGMAAAMCMSRPIIHLKVYIPKLNLQHPCYKKCENCDLNQQFVKWEHINGQYCGICHCKNQVDPNCKTIRCENKCGGVKGPGCVQCKCADKETKKDNMVKRKIFDNGMKVIPDFHMPIHQINPIKFPNYMLPLDQAPTPLPTFQNIVPQHLNYINSGVVNRKKRSIERRCDVVAEVFEGYSPLDEAMKMPVDYIHDC